MKETEVCPKIDTILFQVPKNVLIIEKKKANIGSNSLSFLPITHWYKVLLWTFSFLPLNRLKPGF